MQIAELFVNLGLKGADQTGKALGNVKTGLGEVKSMSLEAKAAILAAVYGLEHLMSNSAQAGTGLSNFTALTGLSAKSLQQWQYAARQAGVSGEELTGSMKAVQGIMTNMLLGGGQPKGLAMLANTVGFDQSKARDTFYVMQQLQKFAQSVPADVGNEMLKSFGLSEGTIAAMRKGVFNASNFAKAPTYSDPENSQLNKVDVAWANLGQSIQMAMGHFTSKHGMGLIKDLSKATAEILKLANAFTTLAEKVKLFDAIDEIFKGWGMIFESIGSGIDKLTGLFGEGAKGAGVTDKKGNLKENPIEMLNKWTSKKIDQYFDDKPKVSEHVAPQVRAVHHANNQHVEVSQTLNFHHDGKDAKKTGDSVHKAVKHAYRQYQAQAQGT